VSGDRGGAGRVGSVDTVCIADSVDAVGCAGSVGSVDGTERGTIEARKFVDVGVCRSCVSVGSGRDCSNCSDSLAVPALTGSLV